LPRRRNSEYAIQHEIIIIIIIIFAIIAPTRRCSPPYNFTPGSSARRSNSRLPAVVISGSFMSPPRIPRHHVTNGVFISDKSDTPATPPRRRRRPLSRVTLTPSSIPPSRHQAAATPRTSLISRLVHRSAATRFHRRRFHTLRIIIIRLPTHSHRRHLPRHHAHTSSRPLALVIAHRRRHHHQYRHAFTPCISHHAQYVIIAATPTCLIRHCQPRSDTTATRETPFFASLPRH